MVCGKTKNVGTIKDLGSEKTYKRGTKHTRRGAINGSTL